MALPWRDYIFSGKHIIIGTALLVALIIVSGIVDNIPPSKYLKAAAGCAILAPVIFYFLRYWNTRGPLTTPLLVNMTGIIAPTFFYKSYIPWSNVAQVEHVWAMLGHNVAAIENNLIIHKKNGGSKRLFIPTLNPEEKEQFFTIMYNLSKHHGFELIIY